MEYNKTKLKEIANVVMGQSPKGTSYNNVGAGVPFLQGNKTFGRLYPSIDTWTTEPNKVGKKNSVLMSVRAPVGDLNIANQDICIGRGLCSIEMNNGNNQYLFYLLKNSINQIKNKSTGTIFDSINRKELEEIEVIDFGGEIQEKITKVLFDIDKKIELNNQINDNLYEILKRLYNELYLNNINKEKWKDVSLDETTSKFATGLNPRKNFVLGQGNNYYVTIKNMQNNQVILDNKCDYVDDEAIVKINKRSNLTKGDLLFSGIGTIGRVYLIDETPTNWNISESVFTMRPNELISSEFLYLLLLSSNMQNYSISLASGSVQKGIRMADLKKYKFKLPTSEFMDSFTNIIRPIIKKIYLNNKGNNTLIQLRDSLLPKLMNGEIDLDKIEI